jgi:hypothetical protein
VQRALHARRLLLPAAGEPRAPRGGRAGWGAGHRALRGCRGARAGGGRAEPAPAAGPAVSLCALLAAVPRAPPAPHAQSSAPRTGATTRPAGTGGVAACLGGLRWGTVALLGVGGGVSEAGLCLR